MLQAIYGGQVEVVRELLLAGAYPPLPTVTSDPAILSLLYPQQQFGAMPSASEQGQQGPGMVNGEVPGFHPGMHQPRHSLSGEGHPRHGHDSHKLPPLEVSKMIPCRNFPNCRYGDACIFQHPAPISGTGAPFYPSPYPNEFVPGFNPAYIPAGFPQGVPMPQMFYPQYPPVPPHMAGGPFIPLDSNASQSVQARGASPYSTTFVPFNPTPNGPQTNGQVSPQTANPALDASATTDASKIDTREGETAPADTTTSADHDAVPPLGAFPAAAPQFAPRHSVPGGFPGQMPFYPGNNAGYEPRRNGHMKKMSFSAKNAGNVNARAAVLGTWTNGQPPPCVFFQNSKCRNGEMCKFPHIGPDGVDVRHPDVINGTLAPAPISLGNPFRGIRGRSIGMGNGGHYERHQHVQAMKAQAAAARNAAPSSDPTDPTAAAVEPPVADDAAQGSKSSDETSSNDTRVEEQAAEASAPSQPKSSVTRSVPNTRAGSPNPTFGNFRNGRAGRTPQQNGRNNSRSTSIPAGQREVKQKLPSADDFPALSGSTGSLASDSVVLVKPVAFSGKTAAQVLSAPAPVKPAKAEAEVKSDDDKNQDLKRVSSVTSAGNVSDKHSLRSAFLTLTFDQDVTTESDDEAVIISHTPTPATRAESKPAPLSFAAAAAAAAASASAESAVLVASTA